MKPHKHAELIKAWADGQAEVEYRYPKDDGSLSLWKDLTQCVFHEWYEYRIKPETKPDVAKYVYADFSDKTYSFLLDEVDMGDSNLKLTFDGETGELKSAEALK
jgi:hypothetical protein